jgi:hypothetical protein
VEDIITHPLEIVGRILVVVVVLPIATTLPLVSIALPLPLRMRCSERYLPPPSLLLPDSSLSSPDAIHSFLIECKLATGSSWKTKECQWIAIDQSTKQFPWSTDQYCLCPACSYWDREWGCCPCFQCDVLWIAQKSILVWNKIRNQVNKIIRLISLRRRN